MNDDIELLSGNPGPYHTAPIRQAVIRGSAFMTADARGSQPHRSEGEIRIYLRCDVM